MQERQKFDEIFERVLSELQPVCLAEQEFCIEFFNLNAAGSEVSYLYKSCIVSLWNTGSYFLPLGRVAQPGCNTFTVEN